MLLYEQNRGTRNRLEGEIKTYFKQNEITLIEIFNNRTHALLGDDFFEVPHNGRGDRAPCATYILPALWGSFRWGAGFSGPF